MNKNRKDYYDKDLNIEVTLGHYASQADGAAWLKKEGTVVLATVTRESSKEFPGFFPLSVDYREVYSATGKIPGGYFKREGKPTDREVLMGRIIDRTIRPLFPEFFFEKVSIVITAYSIDKKSLPLELALMGASFALEVSDIPFMGPVGCVDFFEVNGSWVATSNHEDFMSLKSRLIVAGDYSGVTMLEGFSHGVSKEVVGDLVLSAHEKIKRQVVWQRKTVLDFLEVSDAVDSSSESSLIQSFSDKKNYSYSTENASFIAVFEKVQSIARLFLSSVTSAQALFVADKKKRSEVRAVLEKDFLLFFKEKEADDEVLFAYESSESFLLYCFNIILKSDIMDAIVSSGKRLDGRSFDEVRPLSSEISLLPSVHGSGLFTRGETQVLASVTLGGDGDILKPDTVVEEHVVPFMLHYNFPPFSVGEARGLRPVSRREIGHGFLAQNSLRFILPDYKEFPYSVRVVADVLSCNGSSSMATVCSSVLALFDAGVPLIAMPSGVAMGVLFDKNNTVAVLTDISGIEDELGLMDLKVVGTRERVTGIQMDIKYKGGLSKDLLMTIFSQAEKARCQILTAMSSVISKPNSLSPLVPQQETVLIRKDKIGALIGAEGKNIKQITRTTNTQINIEDSGQVKVFGLKGEGFDRALFFIKMISGQVTTGVSCQGVIKKIVEFGCFIEVAPGCDGLLHNSAIKERGLDKSSLSEGQEIQVTIVDHDKENGRIKLK
jgi:polyribonucleotide nucleotidyltransferase